MGVGVGGGEVASLSAVGRTTTGGLPLFFAFGVWREQILKKIVNFVKKKGNLLKVGWAFMKAVAASTSLL